MKFFSILFLFIACALMIASAFDTDLQITAIMAILFAIYYKID